MVRIYIDGEPWDTTIEDAEINEYLIIPINDSLPEKMLPGRLYGYGNKIFAAFLMVVMVIILSIVFYKR